MQLNKLKSAAKNKPGIALSTTKKNQANFLLKFQKLRPKSIIRLSVPLVKNDLPKLAAKATSSILDIFERKISGKAAVRAGKGFFLFISNEDMDILLKGQSHQKNQIC